jgi:hypothetical protein
MVEVDLALMTRSGHDPSVRYCDPGGLDLDQVALRRGAASLELEIALG